MIKDCPGEAVEVHCRGTHTWYVTDGVFAGNSVRSEGSHVGHVVCHWEGMPILDL